jgi:hypothetical protein
MARHGFTDRPCTTVAGAAAHTVALQAQDLAQARLGVRARSATLTEADVESALAARRVARTWLMRNTIHLVDADDLRWLVSLLGPMVRRRFAKRWHELGLTRGVLLRAEAVVPSVLAAGPLTRHELVTALRSRGVDVDPSGQAPTHLAVYLSTLGLTCHADGDRFALLDDWLPAAAHGPRGDDALAELARRYFRAFSPATGADFTAWSGLPSGRAVGLIREELTPVDVHGRPGFRLGVRAAGGGVRLLSAFDNYLIGYRDRRHLITDERRGEVYVGGIIRPTVVHDGRVVGRWRLDRARGRVEVRLFEAVPPAVQAAIEAEAADIARFVGRELELSSAST